MTTSRVLPADVYDALELSAEAAGGVGATTYFRLDNRSCPNCIIGHAVFLDGTDPNQLIVNQRPGPVRSALYQAFNNHKNLLDLNDDVVEKGAVAGRYGHIPFEQWCAELNVVRGA